MDASKLGRTAADAATPSLAVRAAPPETMAEIAAALPATEPAPARKKLLPGPDAVFGKFLILEGWSHWFFRLGFASIFFINAVYAALEPQAFADLLAANPLSRALGQTDLLIKITMVNDLLLTIFIVGGWRKRMVYAWAGGWLLLVAGLKLMNLWT